MPYRIDIPAAGGGGDAFDRLVELGALDADSSPDGVAALMPDHVAPGQVAAALGSGDLRVSAATARDAGSVWVLHQRPVHVGRLQIVPPHGDAGPWSIRLSDSPAFGTGLHPTTALCIEALDEAIAAGPPDVVLDVGTGSGILALAALRLGVPKALGIDIADEAIAAATENAHLNDVAHRFAIVKGGPETVTGAWPLVIANVQAAPLIEMAPTLARRLGHQGRVILSGIPGAVERDVDQAYRRLGLHHARSLSRGGWVALVMRASW